MSMQVHRGSGLPLPTLINSGLIVAIVVMLASFYVRFVNPYPPLWTAFAMPAAMALFGLRVMLQPRDRHHDGHSQRSIGGLILLLSLILLVLGLYELDRANRSRSAHFNPNPTATDPLDRNTAEDAQ